jgi:hypothetical protein
VTAIAWPDRAIPVATRLGYTASPVPYLSVVQVNGVTITIDAGSASLYAGAPADVGWAGEDCPRCHRVGPWPPLLPVDLVPAIVVGDTWASAK